jgi:hypothetical protein
MSVHLNAMQLWSQEVTAKIRAPSPSLGNVNSAITAFETDKTQPKLQDVAQNLAVWRTTGPIKERTELAAAALDLESYIKNYRFTNVVINRLAGDFGQSRFYDLRPATVANWAWLAPAAVPTLPPFTPIEVLKVNEAFARSYRAATAARDEMVKIAAKTTLPTAPAGAEKAYVDYFGAFDATRAKKVLANFKDIVDAFDQTVLLYDIRNWSYGADCYAACFPGKVTRSSARTASKVTSQVEMIMGRFFFSDSIPRYTFATTGGEFDDDPYTTTTDQTTRATVQTIVHEMAHGCFMAVDAPRVKNDNSWELSPKTSPAEEWGASPVNAQQSSNRKMDQRLARKDPNIAIVNADCYGQFAVESLYLAS